MRKNLHPTFLFQFLIFFRVIAFDLKTYETIIGTPSQDTMKEILYIFILKIHPDSFYMDDLLFPYARYENLDCINLSSVPPDAVFACDRIHINREKGVG